MQFYLGTHQPAYLTKATVPLFISHRRLVGRVIDNLPRARISWALDSGGFSELSLYGQWRTDPLEYVQWVKGYDLQIGNLDWAAPQDWMCEPWIIAQTGLSVREHQERTVANFVELPGRGGRRRWRPRAHARARGAGAVDDVPALLADTSRWTDTYGPGGNDNSGLLEVVAGDRAGNSDANAQPQCKCIANQEVGRQPDGAGGDSDGGQPCRGKQPAGTDRLLLPVNDVIATRADGRIAEQTRRVAVHPVRDRPRAAGCRGPCAAAPPGAC